MGQSPDPTQTIINNVLGMLVDHYGPMTVSKTMLVEWAERMPDLLPAARWEIRLEHGATADERTIRWQRTAVDDAHGRQTK